MKKFIVAIISVTSFSVMANERSLSETLSRIERENNVRCELVKKSPSVCLGSPVKSALCYYKKTFTCDGAESFKLKLRVRSSYNLRTNSREIVVTKIVFK